jgi:hypothetical protein
MQSRSSPALPAGRAYAGQASLASDRELRAVVLTTFFPNSGDPHRTVFVRNLVEAMSRRCAIDVVAPVPLRPWRIGRRSVPASEVDRGIRLLHPQFLSVPGLQWLSGCSYFVATLGVLRRLRRTIGPFVLHAHCAYPDAVGAALAAKLLRLPLVVTVHGSDINIVARKLLLRGQIRWALRSAAQVVAVSATLADRVAALTGASSGSPACRVRATTRRCFGRASGPTREPRFACLRTRRWRSTSASSSRSRASTS